MKLLSRFTERAIYGYRLYIRRDPFLKEVQRWFRDKGDQTLRLDYPLGSESLVMDVGGYRGDFAHEIHKRYGCHILIFEPVPEFYRQCVERFATCPEIEVYNFGLGDRDTQLPICLLDDGTSYLRSEGKMQIMTKIRKADLVFDELEIQKVDLLKINIEGGEYDLLPLLVESGWIGKVEYLQIQFHTFVKDAEAKREVIRNALKKTHEEMWNYEFVWECWKRRKDASHNDETVHATERA